MVFTRRKHGDDRSAGHRFGQPGDGRSGLTTHKTAILLIAQLTEINLSPLMECVFGLAHRFHRAIVYK
jgi:hypothetical protein